MFTDTQTDDGSTGIPEAFSSGELKIQFEILHVHNLGPSSRKDLDSRNALAFNTFISSYIQLYVVTYMLFIFFIIDIVFLVPE